MLKHSKRGVGKVWWNYTNFRIWGEIEIGKESKFG